MATVLEMKLQDERNRKIIKAALENESGDAKSFGSYLRKSEVVNAVFNLPTVTEREQQIREFEDIGRKNGFYKDIHSFYKEARADYKQQIMSETNMVQLAGYEDMCCGRFTVNSSGVTVDVPVSKASDIIQTIRVCYQPILITKILNNIDDDSYKVKLTFGGKSLMVPRETLAARNTIVNLAKSGIDVTSESAKYMVEYFRTLEQLNPEIERSESICRLGWFKDNKFAPYSKGVEFDGVDNIYDSVRKQGSFDKWLDAVKRARAGGDVPNDGSMSYIIQANNTVPFRMYLAGSFAAPLVKLIGCQMFFEHLWGKTGTGKSVALDVNASVWGDPDGYVQTMSGTAAGLEHIAALLCNLPMCMDELQTTKGKADEYQGIVYMLTEGTSKARSKRSGGLQALKHWNTLFFTNGESPLTNHQSGAGSLNRVINIECDKDLFKNPSELSMIVHENFGHAGEKFIEIITEKYPAEMLKSMLEYYKSQFIEKMVTGKQASAAATIMVADKIITDEIFQDGIYLSVEAVSDYLLKEDSVLTFNRAFDEVKGWIIANESKFNETGYADVIWGKYLDDDTVAIIPQFLKNALKERGYDYEAFLAEANENEVLICDGNGKRTKSIRFGKKFTRCVVLVTRVTPCDTEGVTPESQ